MVNKQDKAILKLIFKPITKIFESSLLFHVIVCIVTAIIYGLYLYIKPEVDLENNYIDILNTIGILSTFIIFVSERIDIKDLIKMTNTVSIKGVFKEHIITEADYLINTFMSFITIELLLLAIQYLLLIFELMRIYLLIWSIVYLIFGFLLIIGIWHGIEINKKTDK